MSSALIASVLAVSAMPYTATAKEITVSPISPVVYNKESGTENNYDDLYKLASSLGADTDCFSFPNYLATGVSDEFFAKVKADHHMRDPESFLRKVTTICAMLLLCLKCLTTME